MTREEAINVLEDYDINFERNTAEEVAEAHEMAIKALQEYQHYKDLAESYEKTINKLTKAIQEQPEKRTEERTETHECDYISRKAIIDALHRYFADGFDSDKWWNSTHVLGAINEVSSATPQSKEEPQPKTGHWIWCASSHKCSNCGGYVCFSHKKLLKYCPECGAKMQEVQK